MATTDNERHLRYILLLGEGGLLILRAILQRETNITGDTLDALLQPHKRSLSRKMNNKQYQKLYPPTGNVDKTTWDILLLGTVILQLFEPSLSGDASHDIRKLKDLRNDLAHPASMSMNEDEHDDARKELVALLIKLSSGLDHDVRDKCQNFVKQYHTDPIYLFAATERLKEISKFDETMAEQLRAITGQVEDILVKVDRNYDAIQGSEQLVDLDVAKENAALFDEITELLKRSDRKHVEVMMLIGRTGAGKSAMINTIHKVLTGKYYQIATQGQGRAQSVTFGLGRYENCGVTLETIKDEDKRQRMEKIVKELPHIVDCAGFGDNDSPELREILELLVGGFIPPTTNIEALLKNQKDYGIGSLKLIFPTPNPAWRVTKVVFMQSCREAIPKKLIECLTGVLKISDTKTLTRKYTAEVFLLITKYDLVRDASLHISDTNDDDSMSLEEFVKIEDEIAPEFNIVGALEPNRIRWASFTDRLQGDNIYIENIALKFIKRMVEPGTPAYDSSESVMGIMKRIELYMFKLTNQIQRVFLRDMQLHISSGVILAALMFVAVITVLYKLLSVGV